MKNIVVTLLVLFTGIGLSLKSNAQNVGVGTTTPQEKLDVDGAIKIGTDTNDSTIAPIGGAGTLRFKDGQFEGWDGAAWIPLGGGAGTPTFVNTGGLVQPNPAVIDLTTDDFIFGATYMDEQVNPDFDSRFFFDKSKGAFRSGLVTGDQWDEYKRGFQSFAVGYDVTASGDYSVTMGEKSRSTGIGAIALGRKAYAYGDYSFAWGNHSQATGTGALSFGHRSFATADFSYASGSEVYASGRYSVAFGANVNSSNYASIGVGYNVEAAGEYSVAAGADAYALNDASVAIGYDVTSSGEGAFVIGANSTASGDASIAAGWSNYAAGTESMALGRYNNATGDLAMALGVSLTASGYGSVAMGHYNEAFSSYEHVVGRYNTVYIPTDVTGGWEPTDRLFTVGNGTGFSNRSDALTILKSGYVGIGTSTPAATFHLDGTFRYEDGNQNNGYVLTSDGSGNATWQAPAPTSDDQNLAGATLTGTTLQIDIEDGTGTSVDLSSLVDDADADASNEIQSLNLSGNTLSISGSNDVDLSGYVSTDDQNLSGATLTGTTLQIDIEDGTGTSVDLSSLVNDADADASNEIQSLNLTGNTLSISGSNDVDLSGYVSTDDQNLAGATLSGTTLQIDIEDGAGTSVDLSSLVNDADADASNEIQSLNLTGNTLSISGSNDVDLSGYVSTDDQNLAGATLTGTTLQIDIEDGAGTSVDLSSLVDDADADPTNEFQDLSSSASGTNRTININNGTGTTFSVADNDNDASNEIQSLNLMGNTLSISGSNDVDLSGYVSTDDQNLSGATLTGTTLQIDIEDGTGTSVDLSSLVDDADADPTNEFQDLSSSASGTNRTININNGTGTTFSVADNDNDATNEFNTGLGLTGTTLQITDGGGVVSVDLASLVNDGDWSVSGNDIYNANTGNVGIGTMSPDAHLHISNSTVGETGGIKITQTNYNSLIYHNSDGDLVLRKAINADQLVLDESGKIGIGTDAPGDELHVEGSIRMVDGNEADGYVITSNANGTMSWQNPRSAVNFAKQTGTLSGTGSTWYDVATNGTKTIEVTSGDIISVWGDANVRFTSGSGSDDFEYRVSYSGCATGNMQTKSMRFNEDGSNHDNWQPLPYVDAMVAPCSGTLTFKYSVRRSLGDDSWEAKNGVVLFRRN